MTDITIKKILDENPTISSLDEFCALSNKDMSNLTEDDIYRISKMIDRNVIKLKIQMKNTLYKQKTRPSLELLFRLVGDEDDLIKLGVTKKQQTVSVENPVIEIKAIDGDILNKIREL